MSFLLLFQNLCMNGKTDHYFTRRRVFTSGLLIWTLENFHSIYYSAAVAEFPAGVTSQEESFLTKRQMRDPNTHPFFQSRRLLNAMQEQPGCACRMSLGSQSSAHFVPAQGSPVAVLQLPAWTHTSAGLRQGLAASLPDSLVQDTPLPQLFFDQWEVDLVWFSWRFYPFLWSTMSFTAKQICRISAGINIDWRLWVLWKNPTA